MTAQAITAPEGALELGGQTHALRFDHEQIRQTELCWQIVSGSIMGYLGILHQAQMGVYTALYALAYGALASAQRAQGVPSRSRMRLEQFDRIADYGALVGAGDALVRSAMDALPGAQGASKNA